MTTEELAAIREQYEEDEASPLVLGQTWSTIDHEQVGMLLAEVDRLRAALARARDDLQSWGAYAADYFQQKHDLAGDLAAIDAALDPWCESCGQRLADDLCPVSCQLTLCVHCVLAVCQHRPEPSS